jgi:hypothetical protein
MEKAEKEWSEIRKMMAEDGVYVSSGGLDCGGLCKSPIHDFEERKSTH